MAATNIQMNPATSCVVQPRAIDGELLEHAPLRVQRLDLVVQLETAGRLVRRGRARQDDQGHALGVRAHHQRRREEHARPRPRARVAEGVAQPGEVDHHAVLGDDHALARGEPVGLDHHRRLVAVDVRVRRPGVGEGLVARGGNAVVSENLLRQHLVARDHHAARVAAGVRQAHQLEECDDVGVVGDDALEFLEQVERDVGLQIGERPSDRLDLFVFGTDDGWGYYVGEGTCVAPPCEHLDRYRHHGSAVHFRTPLEQLCL